MHPAGETGCGKTTQVPQFLLDEAAASGQRCSIVCTQPRRISAIGVAERVAAERCERIGGVVGFSIRLESATSATTRLLFCTTGILLRRLEDDPQLATVSHVIVDEVHERSMESDFLLMVLRGLLTRRRDLKLVLMSATINASLFADYFGAGTPTISIPGRTFPVTALYLEDALELTGHRVRPGADWARKGSGGKRSSRSGFDSGPGDGLCFDFSQGRCDRGDRCRFSHGGESAPAAVKPAPAASFPAMGGGSGGGGGLTLASRRLGGSANSLPGSDVPDEELSEAELAERYPRYGAGTLRALAALDHSQIDYDLLTELVGWIISQGSVESAQHAVGGAASTLGTADDAWDAQPAAAKGRGAPRESPVAGSGDSILVFLPGLKEITAAHEQLTGWGPLAAEPQRSWVLPLHGSMTSDEQRRIFLRPPPGVRKVVLATNIAETSITIDDCAFVIDCGRMKETRYDPARRMESLEDVPVSRANARQRRGRAGRVMSGVAFHLVTRHTFERRLEAAQAPEMHRVPLEQLVLRIKVLRYPGTAAQVVSRCLEPPAAEAVSRAVSELVRLEALSATEELTPLGTHLAALPVDVRIGKLILLGAIFNVVDDVLTIAAVLSYRSPFLSPFERRAEADASKRAFAVGQSDHLTALNAYREFDRGGARRFDMCRERYLGVKTLMQIASIKRQLLELLSDARFVRPGLRSRAVEAIGRRGDGSDGVRLALQEGVAGGALSSDACFRCGQRGHAARECTQPERRVLYSAADAWQDGTVNGPLIKALLTAALYPQVMCVTYPQKKGGKAVKAESLKFHIREDSSQVVEVAIHPSSVNAKEAGFDSQYLVFHEKVRTTRIYVRDCSTVSPFALMLFGGALGAERARKGTPGDALLTVDGWIKFR
jgi:ATP-dependent RNA helicase DHX57